MFELRQAVRALVRRPAYTLASIATLALVIGVNAALFAAINATLFRPIPLRSGERTVNLYLMPPGMSDPKFRNPLHAIDLVRFRERSRTLAQLAAFTTADRVLGTGGEPAVVNTAAGQRRDAAAVDRGSGARPHLHRRRRDPKGALDRPQLRRVAAAVRRRSRHRRPDRAARRRTVHDHRRDAEAASRRRSSSAEIWTPLGITGRPRRTTARTNIVTIARARRRRDVRSRRTSKSARSFATCPESCRGRIRGGPAASSPIASGSTATSSAPLNVLLLRRARAAADRLLQYREPDPRARDVALRRAGAPPRDRRDAMGGCAAGAARDRDRQCGRRAAGDRHRPLGSLPALLAIAPATTQVLGEVGDGLARGAVRGRVRRRCRRSPPVSSRHSTPRTLLAAITTASARFDRLAKPPPVANGAARRTDRAVRGAAGLGGVLLRAYFRTSRLAVGYDPSGS